MTTIQFNTFRLLYSERASLCITPLQFPCLEHPVSEKNVPVGVFLSISISQYKFALQQAHR